MPVSVEYSSAHQIAVIGNYWPLSIIITSISRTSLFALSLILLLFSIPLGLDGKVLPEIHWNSTNPIFRIDNTEHIFVVKINDRVDFICPLYSSASVPDPLDLEVMEIYSVSKWAYDYCALSPDSVLAGVCNNPIQRTYATIVFREYTPKPGGLEFKPGRSYYFISTSTGQMNGLQNKHGGLCSTKNMKVKFEVESYGHSGSATSRSIDEPNSGVVQTKVPVKNGDHYDDQEAGDSDQNEFSNEGGRVASDPDEGDDEQNGNGLSTTTPRLYEIHTRPEGDDVPAKRPDGEEIYGTNARQKGTNSSPKNAFNYVMVLLSSVLYLAFYRPRRFFDVLVV